MNTLGMTFIECIIRDGSSGRLAFPFSPESFVRGRVLDRLAVRKLLRIARSRHQAALHQMKMMVSMSTSSTVA